MEEKSIDDIVSKILSEINEQCDSEQPFPFGCGFNDIDKMLSHYFRKPGLVVLSGRPGNGQTELGLNILLNMVLKRIPVGFISMNLTSETVLKSIIAILERIKKVKMLNNSKLDPESRGKLILGKCFHIAFEFDKYFQISDKQMDINEIMETAKNWVSEHGLKVLYVGESQNFITKDIHEQEALAAQFKAFARELGITVILVSSQVDKSVEERTNKRPKLSDISFSGLDWTADLVLLCYRDDLYFDTFSVKPATCEITVAKGLSSHIAIDLSYTKEYGLFEDMPNKKNKEHGLFGDFYKPDNNEETDG